MNIGIISSHDKKLQLENFCYAYKNILKKHNIYTIEGFFWESEITDGFNINKYYSIDLGGKNQFISKITNDGLDFVILLKGHESDEKTYYDFVDIEKECDDNLIPLATNIHTAEILIMQLNEGGFFK